jgi:DNA-directed RNA polymerase specialized sigma24 family protein
MRVSYRSIAKILARGMPIEGQEYSDKIEEYIRILKRMPNENQQALKASFIFSCLAPKRDQQDLFQELVAVTLTELARYNGRIKDVEAFCYTVAQHKWKTLYRNKKRRLKVLNGGFISLNTPVQNVDGKERELQDSIAGEIEFESELISKVDCKAVLDKIPDRIRAIAEKRLLHGETLSSSEFNILWRYRKQNRDKIRELLKA